LRLAVLEDVFPAPERPLSASEIRRFKDDYGDLLGTFRLEIERELIGIADLSDEALRRRALENLHGRVRSDVEIIHDKLASAGIGGISTAKWVAVLGHVPVAGQIVSLIHSVASLFEREDRRVVGPFAYAGYAHGRLLT
jgi:hypothetical protein